ncbi:MAG: MFS transporter [Holosporaceae bacterium]|jgi:MFS family permease|nr:MFS transporter [Holosporaceae bacterium]
MKNDIITTDKVSLNRSERLSRRRITFFLLFLNVVTSAAVSIYIPNLKQMAVELKTTGALMQMTIVAHLIGEFTGRIMCCPLIDLYGNRLVVLPALVISAVGHLGCMTASSLPLFISMRFLQAIGASVIYIVSLSIINETFSYEEKAGVVGILELYQPIAWILSPFVGTILAEIWSWRLSFLLLFLSQLVGIAFFYSYAEARKSKRRFSVSKLFCDYKSILKNSSFVIYALIPGLFAGGYMIFATSSPFICSEFLGHDAADVAIFTAIPLVFYVMATFAYRAVLRKLGLKASKKIGIAVYSILGVYITLLMAEHVPWTPNNLLFCMGVQCVGSAFLVPVSVLKAIQSCQNASHVGASTVVVFRNLVMSLCITSGVKFNESITAMMASIFMTVGTALVLIMTRRIIKARVVARQKIILKKHGLKS